ncbi:hypothetical protein HDU78_009716 [Chytriomyces hyalinus]|nr:hypothetical protein HDU78_009716 [Chytriomyces hyalinus]
MTKLLLAAFLLLHTCTCVLGQGVVKSNVTVECFDNSTIPAKPIHSKLRTIADLVTDLKVVNAKVGALGPFSLVVTDFNRNSTLLALNETGCLATSIIPFMKDNFLVLCLSETGANVLQLDAKGKTLARVNATDKGEAFSSPKGFAVDKKGNVYFGTIDNLSPEEFTKTGAIFVVKKPSKTVITSKSISVLAKNIDYRGGLAFTDNDQTLLFTSSSANIFKYRVKDCKVTRAKPTLFANVTQFYPTTQTGEDYALWHDIVITKDSILVSVANKVLALSRNGKTLLKTISIESTDTEEEEDNAQEEKSVESPEPLHLISSIFSDKEGTVIIAFFPLLLTAGAKLSYVLTIEYSNLSYASRARQDIICKVSRPTIVASPTTSVVSRPTIVID